MSNSPFNPFDYMKKLWQGDSAKEHLEQQARMKEMQITKAQLEEMMRRQQDNVESVRRREEVRNTYNSIIWKRLAKHHLVEDVEHNVSAGGRLTAVWRPEIDGNIDQMTKECPFTTAAIETGDLDFIVTIDEDGIGVLVSWHKYISTVVENTIYRGMDLDSFVDEIVDERLKLRRHFAKSLELENEVILGALEDLSNT